MTNKREHILHFILCKQNAARYFYEFSALNNLPSHGRRRVVKVKKVTRNRVVFWPSDDSALAFIAIFQVYQKKSIVPDNEWNETRKNTAHLVCIITNRVMSASNVKRWPKSGQSHETNFTWKKINAMIPGVLLVLQFVWVTLLWRNTIDRGNRLHGGNLSILIPVFTFCSSKGKNTIHLCASSSKQKTDFSDCETCISSRDNIFCHVLQLSYSIVAKERARLI